MMMKADPVMIPRIQSRETGPRRSSMAAILEASATGTKKTGTLPKTKRRTTADCCPDHQRQMAVVRSGRRANPRANATRTMEWTTIWRSWRGKSTLSLARTYAASASLPTRVVRVGWIIQRCKKRGAGRGKRELCERKHVERRSKANTRCTF